ncbi:hypothetical protein H5410_022701 [Solanum commersonii]|uniref:Uncharacterized protein n=1 Tax=Solanum commersonii TaxID=4109 RepID=A0A9J5ZII0_SOLCO|nr:hypothetical protein H5410_022701 [Solanum commersonii]
MQNNLLDKLYAEAFFNFEASNILCMWELHKAERYQTQIKQKAAAETSAIYLPFQILKLVLVTVGLLINLFNEDRTLHDVGTGSEKQILLPWASLN